MAFWRLVVIQVLKQLNRDDNIQRYKIISQPKSATIRWWLSMVTLKYSETKHDYWRSVLKFFILILSYIFVIGLA